MHWFICVQCIWSAYTMHLLQYKRKSRIMWSNPSPLFTPSDVFEFYWVHWQLQAPFIQFFSISDKGNINSTYTHNLCSLSHFQWGRTCDRKCEQTSLQLHIRSHVNKFWLCTVIICKQLDAFCLYFLLFSIRFFAHVHQFITLITECVLGESNSRWSLVLKFGQ